LALSFFSFPASAGAVNKQAVPAMARMVFMMEGS
jgi:hypothetical protein